MDAVDIHEYKGTLPDAILAEGSKVVQHIGVEAQNLLCAWYMCLQSDQCLDILNREVFMHEALCLRAVIDDIDIVVVFVLRHSVCRLFFFVSATTIAFVFTIFLFPPLLSVRDRWRRSARDTGSVRDDWRMSVRDGWTSVRDAPTCASLGLLPLGDDLPAIVADVC